MLTRFVTKFCVEPRSPFSEISHHDPKTIGKPPNIVSWPEGQPEFPDDAADDDVPTTLRSDPYDYPIAYVDGPLAGNFWISNPP